MKVLITGAAGFVGKNLAMTLKNIRDGKDRTRPNLNLEAVWEFDVDTPPEYLETWCHDADFVFHLAGVNRPEDPAEYMTGNRDLTGILLNTLKKQGNGCPVMLASSVQASCAGRYDGPYGKSKKAAEELVLAHGSQALVYRFPNVFGKWCRPDYNSAVATFCHRVANDLPVTVHDPDTELELVYIDDLVAELLDALEGHSHRIGEFCHVPVTHRVTLGRIMELLKDFHNWTERLVMPEGTAGTFAGKLWATYLSYLPQHRMTFPLHMRQDHRGSFTELMKSTPSGQFSVNISGPGITKGQHWHHSKWEIFIVVSGRGLIRQRQVGSGEVVEFEVSGQRLEAVCLLPGCAHEIVNLSDTENLVTVIWANEPFDPNRPDTYSEKV